MRSSAARALSRTNASSASDGVQWPAGAPLFGQCQLTISTSSPPDTSGSQTGQQALEYRENAIRILLDRISREM